MEGKQITMTLLERKSRRVRYPSCRIKIDVVLFTLAIGDSSINHRLCRHLCVVPPQNTFEECIIK